AEPTPALAGAGVACQSDSPTSARVRTMGRTGPGARCSAARGVSIDHLSCLRSNGPGAAPSGRDEAPAHGAAASGDRAGELPALRSLRVAPSGAAGLLAGARILAWWRPGVKRCPPRGLRTPGCRLSLRAAINTIQTRPPDRPNAPLTSVAYHAIDRWVRSSRSRERRCSARLRWREARDIDGDAAGGRLRRWRKLWVVRILALE